MASSVTVKRSSATTSVRPRSSTRAAVKQSTRPADRSSPTPVDPKVAPTTSERPAVEATAKLSHPKQPTSSESIASKAPSAPALRSCMKGSRQRSGGVSKHLSAPDSRIRFYANPVSGIVSYIKADSEFEPINTKFRGHKRMTTEDTMYVEDRYRIPFQSAPKPSRIPVPIGGSDRVYDWSRPIPGIVGS
ncbi:hypothetical protein B0A49_06665 [Cryomyces minteri]|uniref:Uncharacterized protein n=1 Tax=Cryomyces minteri TaxID=331657 RepID=A0A4U0X1H9_9PEZI|nr:hypothetical protein B0A49_06665 [Cryomyces minteri]